MNAATKGPSAAQEISRVCSTLTECWGLLVLCVFLSTGNQCVGNYMLLCLRILGLTIHVRGEVVRYSTPSAENDD